MSSYPRWTSDEVITPRPVTRLQILALGLAMGPIDLTTPASRHRRGLIDLLYLLDKLGFVI